MTAKEFWKNKILHPIYKVSNAVTFAMFLIVSAILYWTGAEPLAGIVLLTGVIYIILIKMENHEQRLRDLEGDNNA